MTRKAIERAGRGRDRAQQRGDREDLQAEDEHPPAPEQVGDPPGGHEEGREHDVVGVQDPRQRGDRRASERARDVGEGDVDDRRVDERDGRAERGDGQHRPRRGPAARRRHRRSSGAAAAGAARPGRAARHPSRPVLDRQPARQVGVGCQRLARGAGGPAPRTRGSAFQSISPMPSTCGVITRSACRRAAATVSMLPTITVRTIVSPRRGISASLPVSARRTGRPSARQPRPPRARSNCPMRPVTSTAITGPSPLRAIVATGRLSSTPPSTSSRPSCRGHRREHARDGQARVDRVDHRPGAVHHRLAARRGRSSGRRSAAAAPRSAGRRTPRRAAGAPWRRGSARRPGATKSLVGLVSTKPRSKASYMSSVARGRRRSPPRPASRG